MKRFVALLVAACALLLCAACGEYTPARPQGSGTTTQRPSGPTGTSDESAPFTVRLSLNGQPYVPSGKTAAQWTGTDGSITRADFDGEGVASMRGLDGEYTVTIVNLTDGLVYNPNVYTADNYHRDVTVEVVKAIKVTMSQDTPSVASAYRLTSGNTYEFEFTAPAQLAWFALQGCSLETWCDVLENDIDPTMRGYISNGGGYVNTSSEVVFTSGGVSSTYTKNVKIAWTSDLSGYNYFLLSATSRTGKLPFSVVFTLGSFTGGTGQSGGTPTTYEKKEVEDPSLLSAQKPAGTFRYNYKDTGLLLDGSRFALFEKGTEDAAGHRGDGYYHLYDAETNIYSATLFAVIAEPCEFVDKALADLNNKVGRYDYTDMVNRYKDYCNADGAHAVTEELKEYLQGYAVRERYFNDGNGWAESANGIVFLQSSEKNQWLFCCGYYV